MSLRRRQRNRWEMPDRFQELARYNANLGKYVFTEEYTRRMAELQADFNAWQAEQLQRMNGS